MQCDWKSPLRRSHHGIDVMRVSHAFEVRRCRVFMAATGRKDENHAIPVNLAAEKLKVSSA
jgi:hypothetical protein